jgi:hypothetical protein
MFKLISVIFMAGGWCLSAACLYVVRTPAGVTVMPKERLTFTDTWADTRAWTIKDVPQHAALVNRLVSSERGHLLAHVVEGNRKADLNERLLKAAQTNEKDAPEKTASARSKLTSEVFDLAWGS